MYYRRDKKDHLIRFLKLYINNPDTGLRYKLEMTDGEILRQIRDKDCIDDVLVKEDKLEDTQVIQLQTEIPIPKEAPKNQRNIVKVSIFRKWKLEGKGMPEGTTQIYSATIISNTDTGTRDQMVTIRYDKGVYRGNKILAVEM